MEHIKSINEYFYLNEKKQEIINSNIDIISSRYNENDLLESQADEIVKYLPGWEVWEPFTNGIKAPAGSYTKVFSPIYTNDTDDFNSIVKTTTNNISNYISDINKNGKGVYRIECWLEQSDYINDVIHPSNNIEGNEPHTKNSWKNGDHKCCNWVFDLLVKEKDNVDVYLNRTILEINEKCKVYKKYYTLRLCSSSNSI